MLISPPSSTTTHVTQPPSTYMYTHTNTKNKTHLAQGPDAQRVQAPVLIDDDGQPVHDPERQRDGQHGAVFVVVSFCLGLVGHR